MDMKLPEVWVSLENGQEHYLFEYYPDEINFAPEEFVGLTLVEARNLKQRKSQEFLQSYLPSRCPRLRNQI